MCIRDSRYAPRAMNTTNSVPRSLRSVLSLDDFEGAARRHLPRPVFAYVSGGVEDNVAREGNRAAVRERSFVPRVLAGVSGRSQKACLLYTSPSPRDRTRSRMP